MSLVGSLAAEVTDDAVEFTFTVENDATDPIELEFRSGKVADVAVYRDGVEVWRWSDDRLFTQAVTTEALRPGETLERAFTWDDPPDGEYTAAATLDADERAEARTTVTV